MALIVDRVQTPRGELVLRRRGEHHEVISNGTFLMDTRDGRSERLLVTAALDRAPLPTSILIGGLGVGFSLVEAVKHQSLQRIRVVEVEQSLVDWHRTHLADYSAGALDDPRVELVVTDLVDVLRDTPDQYDVICLDVDNGPDWTLTESNQWLYSDDGTSLLRSRLTAHGLLSVWSAAAAPAYVDRLRQQFDDVAVLEVPVPRGDPDVVMVVRRFP